MLKEFLIQMQGLSAAHSEEMISMGTYFGLEQKLIELYNQQINQQQTKTKENV